MCYNCYQSQQHADSGIVESNHDSVIGTSEGLFIATTPHNSTTLFVILDSLVMKIDGAEHLIGAWLVLMKIQFFGL